MPLRLLAVAAAIAALPIAGCVAPASDAQATDPPDGGGAFVTLLGADTLAVEQFHRSQEGRYEAHVVLRSPETRMTRYHLDLDEAGGLTAYEAVTYQPDGAGGAIELRRERVIPAGDSLEIHVDADGQTQTRRVAGDATALPFIDMIHWPFEEMLARAHNAAADSLVQPLFTNRGVLPFVVRQRGDGEVSVTHPFRGTMDVRVDEHGRMQHLSAGATTRALTVTRVDAFDTEAFAQRSALMDAAGQPFGPLSGRAETVAEVDGARLHVDYGQPARRGRTIFGELVAWGELWRTGANMATHFETSADLRMGDLLVPPGAYTLFSIPERDGGVLIVNRQTGQTGTVHDADQDLGRVPMTVRELPAPVELFTIEVEDTPTGGELRLVWDRTAFVVPFTVEG